jgi:hypothetical protein
MALVAASQSSQTALLSSSGQLRWRTYLNNLILAAFAIGVVTVTLAWNAVLVRTVIWLVWS